MTKTKHPTLDRSTLDLLWTRACALLAERDAIEACTSPAWREAHVRASEAFLAVSAERRRLWKMERWGAWMTAHDRTLARITGEL